MKKKNLTLLVCMVASIVAAVALYFGTGGVNSDMPPSLPNIGGSQFAGSTQVIQINNTNGFHSSLIKPVCSARYVKSLELMKSPLYVSAFGVNKSASVSEFLSKVSPDNEYYAMLLFNQVTQSYVELGSNLFGSIPRIGVEEFDSYTIASNQMVYLFTNSVNKFCFDNDKTLFEPLEEVDGWALIQLYTTQFVPNVRSAFKFNNESKPERYLDSLYKPGFYWFAFDYSDFSEDFGDEGVAVSPFGSFSDKSVYLRNNQNENVSLGVYDVVSEDLVDQITFEVKSQTQAEFLSVVNSIELKINGESFSLAAPDSLSAEGLFVVELNQEMQNALDESKQIEILLNVNSVESNQVVDLSVVFEAGENKSESLDMINVAIFLSDISIVLADNSSDLELINGLEISNYGYSNLDFDVDGTIELESIKLKLDSESQIDPENYFAVDFAVDSEVLFTHRFTNDALEATLPQELVNKLLEEGVKTLEMLINVDIFEDQSDIEFFLETKLAEDDQALLVELPKVKFAAAKIFISDGYFTYSDKCELDSNIYYTQADLVLLSEDFKNVYESLFDDFDSIETIGVGLDVTPYLEISDINFNIDLFGSDVVDVPKSSGFTDLFDYNVADFEGVLINFSSNSYQEEFTEGFNSKRLLSLDKLELSTENLKLRFNLFSDAQDNVLNKLEHKCVSKSDYGFSVDELVFDSKIFVSDLSEFVKLNFTNLVLGKNVFVKVNWEESLLSLLDLTSNPIIEPILDANGMLIGFDYEDSEELGSILDQLLEDLGTADIPMSEQELEDLIESNPISLTVGNANANLITEDFELVYADEIYRACADEIEEIKSYSNIEVLNLDEYINYFYDVYGGECVQRKLEGDVVLDSNEFELFNAYLKKKTDIDFFKLKYFESFYTFDLDGDGTDESVDSGNLNLRVTLDVDGLQPVTQDCNFVYSTADAVLTPDENCQDDDAFVSYSEITTAYNELAADTNFNLKIELITEMEMFDFEIQNLLLAPGNQIEETLLLNNKIVAAVSYADGDCTLDLPASYDGFTFNSLGLFRFYNGSTLKLNFSEEFTSDNVSVAFVERTNFDNVLEQIDIVNNSVEFELDFFSKTKLLFSPANSLAEGAQVPINLIGFEIDGEQQEFFADNRDYHITPALEYLLCNVAAE